MTFLHPNYIASQPQLALPTTLNSQRENSSNSNNTVFHHSSPSVVAASWWSKFTYPTTHPKMYIQLVKIPTHQPQQHPKPISQLPPSAIYNFRSGWSSVKSRVAIFVVQPRGLRVGRWYCVFVQLLGTWWSEPQQHDHSVDDYNFSCGWLVVRELFNPLRQTDLRKLNLRVHSPDEGS